MLIRGYGEAGDAEGAMRTLQKMALRGVAPTLESYNAAVCSMCAVDDLDGARALVATAAAEGVPLDRWAWNSIMQVRHTNR